MNAPTAAEPQVEIHQDGSLYYVSPVVPTPQSLNRFFDQVLRVKERSSRRLLVDMRPHVGLDAATRQVIYERSAQIRDLRIALLARSRLQRATVTFVALAARVRFRCFESPEEARQWLSA